jgi:bacterioferritin-associated ferredoxin
VTTANEARQGLLDLTAIAKRDLDAVWSQISDLPPVQLRQALMDVLPAIADEYGLAAGALAADWYDDARDLAGAGGAFSAEPVPLPDQERFDSLAVWGLSPLFSEKPDPSAALALITGGLQRVIADAHRLTVVESTQADSEATGWKRMGVGSNCGFCRMLIDRGAVYTEASVTFRSHDNCNCVASPTWADNVVKISREPFRQSQKNRSEETKKRDNERARAFIAEHT